MRGVAAEPVPTAGDELTRLKSNQLLPRKTR